MSRRRRARSAAYRQRRTLRKLGRLKLERSLAGLERVVESETLRRVLGQAALDDPCPFEVGKTYVWPRPAP